MGRDLIDISGRRLTLPGFLLMVVTGVSMPLLRYGRRPRIWVWIKLCVATAIAAVTIPVVGPALRAAKELARWPAEHDQLAPQFQSHLTRGTFFGGLVLALFLVNVIVAIWRPFSSRPPA